MFVPWFLLLIIFVILVLTKEMLYARGKYIVLISISLSPFHTKSVTWSVNFSHVTTMTKTSPCLVLSACTALGTQVLKIPKAKITSDYLMALALAWS